jgi:cyclopropane-fatty-acyl-phospholipid synthase
MDLFFEALMQVKHGSLLILFPNGEKKIFGTSTDNICKIVILDENVLANVFSGGDIAFGEAYINNQWTTPDLPNLLAFFTLNSKYLEDFLHQNRWQAFWLYLKCWFNKNTKQGSKKNIQFHYDLGNNFYSLWLDSTMTYSSGLFLSPNQNLHQAQINKYNHIINKLEKGSILEIGCGWGGFANLASSYGFEVTGLTLSKQQQQYCQENFKNQFATKLQDYRDENSIYNNIVSIEMFEAVGKQYWETYFDKISKCLVSKGKAVLQIITISEDIFLQYQNRVDFIQKHIFPGGVLPTKNIIRHLAKKYHFNIISETAFGLDYAKTLILWLENFNQQLNLVLHSGFDMQFVRKWQFYLSYCYAAFIANRTDVVQFELQKNY